MIKWADPLDLHRLYITEHLVSETMMKFISFLSYVTLNFLDKNLGQTSKMRIS